MLATIKTTRAITRARLQTIPPAAMAWFYAVSLSVIPMLCIAATFGFAPGQTPDSPGYISFSARRPALYPLFIAAFDGNLQWVVFAQCAVYTATLLWLIYALHRRFESPLATVAFGLASTGNQFMWYHHTIIMTESLTRSCVNVLAVALLYMSDKRRDDFLKWVALAGAAIGAAAALRPAMHVLAPLMLLAVVLLCVWRGGGGRRIASAAAVLVAATALVAALEAAVYHAKHDTRRSYLSNHLFGKAAMLMTAPGFTMPDLAEAERELAAQTAEFMRPVKDWLRDDAAPALLKMDLRKPIGGFVTMHGLPAIQQESPALLADADVKSMSVAVIRENPLAYIQQSLWRYAGLWAESATAYAIARQGARLPVFDTPGLKAAADELRKHWNQPANVAQALVVFPLFAFHGVVFSLLSLWVLWVWARALSRRQSLQSMPAETMLITIACAVAQASLMMFAFTAPLSLRYLMPLLPLFMLAAALWARVVFCGLREVWRPSPKPR